jgi:hypothetical protein
VRYRVGDGKTRGGEVVGPQGREAAGDNGEKMPVYR